MAKKTKLGRPTVMTEGVIQKLEEAFAWGCTDIEACLWANIDSRTLYKYQEKNPEFVRRKEGLKDTPVMLARKAVVNAIRNGDRTTAMQYLERKKKDEFSTKTESDITSGGDKLAPLLVRFIGEDDRQDGTPGNTDTSRV